MLKSALLVAFSGALLSNQASAFVIYGEDSRIEVYDANPLEKKLAKSAASMIHKDEIVEEVFNPDIVVIKQTSLRERFRSDLEKFLAAGGSSRFIPQDYVEQQKAPEFCSWEKFVEQPKGAVCSGYLIAHDLILTAGHCAKLENVCEDYRWVFDFKLNKKTQTAGLDIKREDVYRCKKIISKVQSTVVGNLDYGLIQLDRSVKGREPLKLRLEGKINDEEGIFAIGNPSGLPLKVVSGANVRDNSSDYIFSANLDTYTGNSGSAVFNAVSGLVEGILVQGEDDFDFNEKEMCLESKVCKDDECRGETVTRVSTIPEISLYNMFMDAARNGKIETIQKILKLDVWVDFYLTNGESPLFKAVKFGHTEVIKALVHRGARADLQNAEGVSPLHYIATYSQKPAQDILEILLGAKPNLEVKDSKGLTPVLAAANYLNIEAIQKLVSSGANINAIDEYGETALFKFARSGDVKGVIRLIDLKIDAKIKNTKGEMAEDVAKVGAKGWFKNLFKNLLSAVKRSNKKG